MVETVRARTEAVWVRVDGPRLGVLADRVRFDLGWVGVDATRVMIDDCAKNNDTILSIKCLCLCIINPTIANYPEHLKLVYYPVWPYNFG